MATATYTNFADAHSSILQITANENSYITRSKNAADAGKVGSALDVGRIAHSLQEKEVTIPAGEATLGEVSNVLQHADLISEVFYKRLTHGISDEKMQEALDGAKQWLHSPGSL